MLFNTMPKQYLIIECTLITGNIQYFYIENLSANTLPHLDTTNAPLRCYKINTLYNGKCILTNDNIERSKTLNLHLNNLLSYSNISKEITLMTRIEYEEFIEVNCNGKCTKWKTEECKLKICGRTEDYNSQCYNAVFNVIRHEIPKKLSIFKIISNYIELCIDKLSRLTFRGGR